MKGVNTGACAIAVFGFFKSCYLWVGLRYVTRGGFSVVTIDRDGEGCFFGPFVGLGDGGAFH